MNSILITTHGSLCEGVLDSLEMIIGKTSDVYTLGLKDSIDDYKNSLETLVLKLNKDYEGLLIISDLKGGTPYNESMKYFLSCPETTQIVTGVNLPMLIETYFKLQILSIEEMRHYAIDSGRQSIIS